MVCIGSDEQSEAVVRIAGRMAAAQKSDWFAVHVRRIDRDTNDRKENRRIEKSLRLAERLGAARRGLVPRICRLRSSPMRSETM